MPLTPSSSGCSRSRPSIAAECPRRGYAPARRSVAPLPSRLCACARRSCARNEEGPVACAQCPSAMLALVCGSSCVSCERLSTGVWVGCVCSRSPSVCAVSLASLSSVPATVTREGRRSAASGAPPPTTHAAPCRVRCRDGGYETSRRVLVTVPLSLGSRRAHSPQSTVHRSLAQTHHAGG